MHGAFSLLKYGQAYNRATSKTEIYKTWTSRSGDLSNTIAPTEKGLLCCKAAKVQWKILCYKLRTVHSLQWLVGCDLGQVHKEVLSTIRPERRGNSLLPFPYVLQFNYSYSNSPPPPLPLTLCQGIVGG
jgi:hypothetical protein